MNCKIKLEAFKLTQEYLCDELLKAIDTNEKEEIVNELFYDLLNYTRQIRLLKKIMRQK